MLYKFSEIFSSLQGEGRNSGRPVTFLRFSNCNLSCPWCDTARSVRYRLTLEKTLSQLKHHSQKSVIITGGEPTIQPGLSELVSAIKNEGYWVALETNGVIRPSCANAFDYIAVSPKSEFAVRYIEKEMLRRANEVRIVASSENIVPFCVKMRKLIKANSYYISPLDNKGTICYRRAFHLLNALNKNEETSNSPWSLSIQLHKILGIH